VKKQNAVVVSRDVNRDRRMEIILSDQILTPEEQSLLEMIYHRVESWKQALAPYHDYVKDCRLIVRRKDPYQDADRPEDESEEGNEQSGVTLQLNTLKSTRDNVVASLLENFPRAALIPETLAKKKMAEDMNDVLDHIAEEGDFETQYRAFVEDYVDVGTGVLQTFWDEEAAVGEGEATVLRWPVEGMLWDPKCGDIPHSRAIMKLSWHPLSWYREHYPDEGIYVTSDEDVNSDLLQNDTDVAEYGEMDDDQQAMLIEYWWREYDPVLRRYRVHVAHAAGNALLTRNDDVYAHGEYPFVFAPFTRIEGTPVGEGLIGEFVPTMRYINRWNRYIDENFRMASKNRMLVRKNAKINLKQLLDFDTDVVEGEAIDEASVRWFQAKPMGTLVPTMMMQLQTDMKQDSGQNQFSRGETAGGVTAMGAIQSLQEAGSKISRYRIKSLISAFKVVVRQLLWIVSEMYDTKRMRVITGRSGEQRDIDVSAKNLMGAGATLKGSDVVIPPYAVRVEVEQKSPSAIQETNSNLMNAYTASVQAGQNFPISMLFDSLTIEGKDRILPLLQKIDNINDKLAQASQMIQQLTTANEALKKQVKSSTSRQTQGAQPQAAPPQGVTPV